MSPTASTPRRVADVMHRGLVSCGGSESLETVAGLMIGAGARCVVIVEGHLGDASRWGVVSDRDLVAAATVRSLAEQEAAGTAMHPAVTIGPHESLDAAARTMTRAGVAYLVVVDPVDRRPLGVLSTLDVAAAL